MLINLKKVTYLMLFNYLNMSCNTRHTYELSPIIKDHLKIKEDACRLCDGVITCKCSGLT